MGQRASSARCPTTAVPRSSQSPSAERMASSNERDPQVSRSSPTSNNAMASSRRRSFSPDPDSLDSRRSSRIRRRISRFVSSNVTADHTSSTDSFQDARPTRDILRSDTEPSPAPSSRVRLPRIRSSLLHRRRSLNTAVLEDNRRSGPSSLIPPQLGPLSFHATRPTGSLDVQNTNALHPREPVASDSDRANERSTSQPSDYRRIGSRPNVGSTSERNRYSYPLHPGRGVRSEESRTTPHSETNDGIAEGSQMGDHPFQINQHQNSPNRTSRETRGSTLSSSSRPSRTGEDQAAVLSRLLSVAAAATAASLVGSNVQAFSDARDVSGGSVDGSFEAFLRALQNGRLTSALRNGGNTFDSPDSDMSDDLASGGSIGPLNFFRMFRFGPTSSGPNHSTAAENARMIPVIIVGIRSVNPRDTDIRDGRTSTFLEALSSAPTISDIDSRRSSLASRSRSTHSQSQAGAEGGLHTEGSASPSTINSPSIARSSRNLGINQPDAADFSSVPSETSGWNSALESPDLSQRSASPQVLDDNVRLSGSSSPDSPRSPTEGTRSWIIYVLGGSYPENHPILTTPSLFTDAPTYEDMMLLSSLIAPVKPPVASREDVDSAGGLFRVRLGGTSETAADDGVGDVRLNVGERCLVCLSDFEDGELCRQLIQCQHVFHRDCIDEWLTTGRNSCPLCRGQGVEETPVEEAAGAAAGANSTVSPA